MRHRFIRRSSIICAGCLTALGAPAYAAAPAQMAFTAQAQSTAMVQGFQDPIYGYIYNLAPAGSATLNYSVMAVFPYSSKQSIPPAMTGTKVADGGASYNMVTFNFDSSKVTAGTPNIGITATDSTAFYNGVFPSSIEYSGPITVKTPARPNFVIGGNAVPLSPNKLPPIVEPNPGQDTASAGLSGGYAAPTLIDDPLPDEPAAELDVDSIVAIGDPQISITLQPFIDLPPDDLADAPPDIINVDSSVPGTYFTQFQLNYSDEQDLAGAAAPGSEQAYFGVLAIVSGTGDSATTSVYIDVPEPAPMGMVVVAVGAALMCRRRDRIDD